ncbi:molybdenum cofactor guanylyltransferase [Actinopolymorpha sp. B9G3]|uniref:molybdenum cofactor guanylyltransferase n=1 Tax=Actinopolymorpha sp. B9G3 TaxID=3158970 RepID=UPI0032D99EC7
MGDQGTADFDVVVLAGGTARRFGGADKVLLPVAGRPMLERVIGAGAAARTVVVVGPQRPLPIGAPTVRWTRERPAGSGPLAAVAAGLELCGSAIVVILAGDMPLLDSTVVRQLVQAAREAADVDGAVLGDAEGRRQLLAGAYVRDSLGRALAAIGDPRDLPMRLLLDELRLATVRDPRAVLDCDTPENLARADEMATNPLSAPRRWE